MAKSDSLTTGEHERLIADHYTPIYRFLRNMVRRSEDAEDLVQQTFVRAITAWDRFDDTLPVRSWLYAIAYREFCKWRRRRLWLPLLTDRPASGNDFAQVDDSEALLKAISGLPQAVQATFLFHYVEDLSIIEISQLMSVPEGTVKSRLSSARQRLKNLMQEEHYVPETI